MKPFFSVFSLGLILFSGVGCQTAHDYVKDTSRYYREYLNPPAKLDLSIPKVNMPAEAILADAFVDLDFQLTQIERRLEAVNLNNVGVWVQETLEEFTWLSGVALINTYGTPMAQMPMLSLKSLNFDPLLEIPEKHTRQELRSYVQDSSLGAEIYLALPMYESEEFQGVLAVHFDFRSLLPYVYDPSILFIAAPHVNLWTGSEETIETPFFDNALLAKVKAASNGTHTFNEKKYYWIVRYFGNTPLVFAVIAE